MAILVGVIGGSGLYHLDNLTFLKNVNPETPWGFPSSPIAICALPTGTKVAFLARHGVGHTLSPSVVPSRANIAALKSLGVRAILAFSAVGSLREEFAPGDFVLPTQIIDRTKGVRPASFFEDTSVVAHAAFGDPFALRLVRWLEERVRKVLEEEETAEHNGRGIRPKLHSEKCIVCMEGPQFSTRAESQMYRTWGGDVINMSVLPEAKLAREAELGYALIATVTDYDSWRPHESSVTAAEVFKTLHDNARLSRHVAATILEELHAAAADGELLTEEVGSMRFSIMPRSEKQKDEDRKKLSYILPTSALLKAKDAEIAKLKSRILELERIIAHIGGGGPSAGHSTLKQGLKNGPETDDPEFRNELVGITIRRSARATKKVDYVHLHNGSNAAAKRKRAEVDEGKQASVSSLHKKRYLRGKELPKPETIAFQPAELDQLPGKVQENGEAGKLRDTSDALQNVHVTEDRAGRNVAKPRLFFEGKKLEDLTQNKLKAGLDNLLNVYANCLSMRLSAEVNTTSQPKADIKKEMLLKDEDILNHLPAANLQLYPITLAPLIRDVTVSREQLSGYFGGNMQDTFPRPASLVLIRGTGDGHLVPEVCWI
ncbi:S-methyl-5'-thioadenosine phosphorylase [Grifola frondosa]|uniref:S-methyl-5'-thioadenosine phosphorylase n=1 Tax=Grifola frondosa TaxID=5627 RepID=A0A1C7LL20_GRIFR|nr:S-methyl-5'-thioadenosine phosphorylase [Grifola frondosa]